jgi:hypothetical protein
MSYTIAKEKYPLIPNLPCNVCPTTQQNKTKAAVTCYPTVSASYLYLIIHIRMNIKFDLCYGVVWLRYVTLE